MELEEQSKKELVSLRAIIKKHEALAAKKEKVEQSLRKRHRKLLKQIADLKQAQQQVIQRERLHALGQMASGIVHDFNNSLTPILGASDFLLMNPDMLDDKVESKMLLESIRTAARDAKNVVRRLREFYKPDEGTPVEPVDVNPLIEQVIRLTQPKWRRQPNTNEGNIEIITELSRIPPVTANESHLREVLTNLILNSIDAMADGGRITISTALDNKWVVIKVTDTGKGMTNEVCQRCFEPFFSTKGKNGTGLGLSMAYGMIQKYGGTIATESELGKGTTMTIRLPAGTPRREQINNLDDASVVLPPLAILVADDDSPSRNIVTKHLEADGHQVETAANGQDMLSMCMTKKFDLILLGRIMLNTDMRHIASEISGNFPETRLILLTGYNDPTDETMPKGVDLILEKPVTQMELRRAIAQVLLSRPCAPGFPGPTIPPAATQPS